MSYQTYRVMENTPLSGDVYRLLAQGPTECMRAPGQFAQVRVEGFYLPRPLSVCDWTPSGLEFVYRVVGEGTRSLSQKRAGETIEIMAGLGNGFSVSDAGASPLLVGGGLGAAPLVGLARRLGRCAVALGFNAARDAILAEEFRALGARVLLTTLDGSAGQKGFVTDAIRGLSPKPSQVYACGPEPMLKAVHGMYPGGQFSFEARMACGFGACMGCSCRTKFGSKRICADGPVIRGEEILW